MIFILFLVITGIVCFGFLKKAKKTQSSFYNFFGLFAGLLCIQSIVWHLQITPMFIYALLIFYGILGVIFTIITFFFKKNKLFFATFGFSFIAIILVDTFVHMYQLTKYFID